MVLGIDIGTTRCKQAYVDPSGKPTIILNARGEPSTPSVVYVPEHGEPLVGMDAVEQGYIEPERCARDFKLKLGAPDILLPVNGSLNATQLTAILIRQLKADAERQLGVEITECVATCPANFKDHSKQALEEAFRLCGIKVLKIVPEPTAAALAYTEGKIVSETTFAVYDFGGGTFDVSVVAVKNGQVVVLATEGVPRLGGNDINEAISHHVLEEVEREVGRMPSREGDALFCHDLDQRVEAAKISLDRRPTVPIVLALAGHQIIGELKQTDFHGWIEPLVKQSLEALDKAVANAGLTLGNIGRLVLVGGTSKLSHVREMVAKHTGLTPRTDIDPEKAVAYGAASAALIELANQGRTATIRGQVIPTPNSFYQDVTAHGVGCCVLDKSQGAARLVNSIIIPKNTPIPCQRVDQFFLEDEAQTEARIEILQGEANAERDNCLLIGELTLSNLPKETTRTRRIRVEYIVNSNGMVTATATDLISGQKQTVSVDYKKGIKPKDKLPAA